jgi:hypothetical protein
MTTPLDPALAAWTATWRAIRSNATYNHEFGFESAWRGQWAAWGYPMEDDEILVVIQGKNYQARNFSKAGLVYWDIAQGAKVFGRPV